MIDEDKRTCDRCELEVPLTKGLYHATLRLLVHKNGLCDRALEACSRDYSRSKKGKLLPRQEVIRRMKAWEVPQ